MMSRFRPPWIASLAVLLLLPGLIGLGVWQLQRAQEKRALQAQYDSRAGAQPLPLAPYPQEAADLQFRRVRARGVFEAHYQVLLDNRVYQGRPGYHVLTPLRIEGSEVRVLVNRGWVELGERRERLPAVEVPLDTVDIVGTATVPAERPFLLGTLEILRERGPTVWQQLDLERYTNSVPFKLQPIVILLDPQSATGGFTRDWARLDAGIAVHQGYAFQWFALAGALLVLYVYFGRRAGRRPDQPEGQITP
jgi:surfeit locus 1 family protein